MIRVLTEIAHFHAVSYQYLQKSPGGMEKLRKENPLLFLESYYDNLGDDPKVKEGIMGIHQTLFKNCAKVV